LATGHYAQIRKSEKTGEYELLKAKDKNKDQTYSLSFLPQKWLRNIIFPLGQYTKKQVYQLAKKEGFDFFLKRKQSQDFCFVSGKCFNCFLEKELGKKLGLIKDNQGNILGEHQGLHFYTIGQRKGIKLSNGPYFVIGFNVKKNILIVSKNKKDLFKQKVVLSSCHFLTAKQQKNKIKVQVKIRSQHSAAKADLTIVSKNKAKLVFDKPQRAITPGQFAVFYKGKVCLGGGIITSY